MCYLFKIHMYFLSNLSCNFCQHYIYFTGVSLQSVFYNFHHRYLYILISIQTFICKYHSTNLDIFNVTLAIKLWALKQLKGPLRLYRISQHTLKGHSFLCYCFSAFFIPFLGVFSFPFISGSPCSFQEPPYCYVSHNTIFEAE